MPSKELTAEEKLIAAGIELAKKYGINGFSVRPLCSKAKVNLGLFHYHFTSRQNFNKAVLKELYKELLKGLDMNISADLNPIEKLEIIGNIIGDFTRDNAPLLLSIIADILSGNKEMFSFIKSNFTKHILFTISIIEECKKKGLLKNYNSASLTFSLIAPAAIPNIAAEAFKRIANKKDYKKVEPFIKRIASHKLVKERIEMFLKGSLK
ncbi:MAG: TetR/AcrR family transcriptional regulator [Elusimicrobiota bacterium]|jgi:AcrR family transcriptional regulator|nr:TetR/AcrR family transcriptional regulator [Elusimicrobiota bacterium]